MNIQLLPTRVPELVDDEIKGTAIGAIVVVGLIVAILVQPMAGAFSDRVRLRWGRRRPIMAAGIAAAIPCLLFVAYAPNYGCCSWPWCCSRSPPTSPTAPTRA